MQIRGHRIGWRGLGLALWCVAGCAGDGGTPASETTSEPGTSGSTDASGSSGAAPTSGDATSAGSSSGETSSSSGLETTAGSTTGAVLTTDPGTETGGSSEAGTSGDTTGGTDTGGDTSTGGCAPGMQAEAAALALTGAVDGVYYPSESDYFWDVYTFACAAPVTVENIQEILAPVYVQHDDLALADRAVEVRTMAQLFDPLTVPQDWWTDDEVERAEQYTKIRMALEDNLSDLQVFRLGEPSGNILVGAIDLYVFGSTADGDLVAIGTISVET